MAHYEVCSEDECKCQEVIETTNHVGIYCWSFEPCGNCHRCCDLEINKEKDKENVQ